ncbi:MAG TPA: response regulator [Nitrososphaeraceae archaeon]|jgi:CheY-like chemotaxis protein|nr:response regulator [Nitrososphaeraceae archaeon]
MKKNNNKILLVDNEPDIALAFKIGLEDNGFVVDAFNDPLEALSSFKDDFYDLLLLDIKMPNMNGIEFYQQMKEIDKKVKICFITASEMHYYEEIRNEIFPILGVRRLIRKPIKMDDLVEDLREELKSIDYNTNTNNKYN